MLKSALFCLQKLSLRHFCRECHENLNIRILKTKFCIKSAWLRQPGLQDDSTTVEAKIPVYADVQFVEKKICTLIALLEHRDTVAGVSVAVLHAGYVGGSVTSVALCSNVTLLNFYFLLGQFQGQVRKPSSWLHPSIKHQVYIRC